MLRPVADDVGECGLKRPCLDNPKRSSIQNARHNRLAQRLVAAEVVHIREMELMLMKSAPE